MAFLLKRGEKGIECSPNLCVAENTHIQGHACSTSTFETETTKTLTHQVERHKHTHIPLEVMVRRRDRSLNYFLWWSNQKSVEKDPRREDSPKNTECFIWVFVSISDVCGQLLHSFQIWKHTRSNCRKKMKGQKKKSRNHKLMK